VEGMFKFERLDVWIKSIALYDQITSLSLSIHQRDQYSLGDQIRRASLSISTNIAEGTGRDSPRQSRYFYNIAKGSVYEVVSLLHVCKKQNCMQDDQFQKLYVQCDEIARMITGLMKR
jgi:four helix bundle protein